MEALNAPKSSVSRLRCALCASRVRRGAAAEENPTDRSSISWLAIDYSSRIEAFRQQLRDLGYIEGQNIIIEFRYAEAETKRFADLAAELIGLKPDVIITSSGAGALAAKSATKTIPIVFISVGDPVGEGLVASLSHPGGNIRRRWDA